MMDRTALPMGKDVLVKGEMITVGKWLARVVGRRARRRNRRGCWRDRRWRMGRRRGERLKRGWSPRRRARWPEGGGGGDDGGGGGESRAAALGDDADAGDATESGWIGGAGDAEGIFSRYERSVGATGGVASARADARVAEVSDLRTGRGYDRAVDPNTGERERWMAGGWRGRAGGMRDRAG